jgi:hypothetical protein
MTWGYAKSALRRVATAFLSLFTARAGRHGLAPNTAPKSSANGWRISERATLIERRALRKWGNNPAGTVREYLAVHRILNKGN